MTANKLKFIACVSMLIDHVGLMLLPEVLPLRYIGRLAMPIFAHFIAEGCRRTHAPGKYFLRVLVLALICQTAFTAEELISGTLSEIYLNILFTFCLSMLICFAYLRVRRTPDVKSILLLIGAAAIAVFCCLFAGRAVGMPVTVDYGIGGVLLPVFAVLFEEKRAQRISFGIGTVVFCALACRQLPFIWYSLLAIPLICAYNGKRGLDPLQMGLLHLLSRAPCGYLRREPAAVKR